MKPDFSRRRDLGSLRPRRVLFVLYYYSPYTSGLTLYVRRLAEDLACRGADVRILCGRHDATLRIAERIAGVSIVRRRVFTRVGKGLIIPSLIPSTLRLARSADVVIPVLPLMEAGLIARTVRRRKLLPIYVCDLNLGDSLMARSLNRFAAGSARTAVSRATQHIALSRDYAEASPVVGPFASRTVGIRPPVDPKAFEPRPAGPLRARLGVGNAPIIGFVGRLVAEKGIPYLLGAMKLVWQALPDARLVIAGEGIAIAGGGLHGELQALAGEEPRVIFTGFLEFEDLLALYSACSVLVLPSVDPLEAFGMVQVEAMLCGCPVVASDLPGVRTPIQETGMGRLVPPADATALAAAIAEVVSHRSDYVVDRSDLVRLVDPTGPLDAFATLVGVGSYDEQ